MCGSSALKIGIILAIFSISEKNPVFNDMLIKCIRGSKQWIQKNFWEDTWDIILTRDFHSLEWHENACVSVRLKKLEVGFRNIVSLLLDPKQSLRDELTVGILLAKDGSIIFKNLQNPLAISIGSVTNRSPN